MMFERFALEIEYVMPAAPDPLHNNCFRAAICLAKDQKRHKLVAAAQFNIKQIPGDTEQTAAWWAIKEEGGIYYLYFYPWLLLQADRKNEQQKGWNLTTNRRWTLLKIRHTFLQMLKL
jgi:hypothetical protein